MIGANQRQHTETKNKKDNESKHREKFVVDFFRTMLEICCCTGENNSLRNGGSIKVNRIFCIYATICGMFGIL